MDFFVAKDKCCSMSVSLGYCLSFIGPHFKISADG